jgi:hypothetical protein
MPVTSQATLTSASTHLLPLAHLSDVAAMNPATLAGADDSASTISLDHIANRSGQKFKDNVQ